MDFIHDFSDFAENNGCGFAAGENIIADNTSHRYRIEGDKLKSKNGSYILKIDHDFAVGRIHNFKDGSEHKYISKSAVKLSSEEKLARKEAQDEQKKKQDDDRAALAMEAAIEANTLWAIAHKTGKHPYLERKKCELNGARLYDKAVIVPIWIDDKISSLQKIFADGSKFFVTGSEIKGGFFPLSTKKEDKSIIVICEGFSTGCSIRAATGYPVICTMQASNLLPVAKFIRKKYPASRIIFAGDNDAYTKNSKGELNNVGVKSAIQAAATIGAQEIHPEIIDDKNTDFNDVYCQQGADAVRAYFDRLPQPATAMQEPSSPQSSPINGLEYLTYDKQNNIEKTINNTIILIEYHPALKNVFRYDQFSHEKIVYSCPPWEDCSNFKARRVRDADNTMLTAYLEKNGLRQPISTITQVLSSMIEKNSFNPAREYFKALKWDGVPRLDRWLTYYCGAEADDLEYVSAVGRKWLIAAVNRVFEPGCKFDNMLILEGEQNTGKSLLLKEIATINGKSYFDDTIRLADFGLDRTVPKLQGVLIVEFAEMSGISKKDVNELKQAITITEDRIVKKYQNEATIYPRQFVMAGTVNPNGTGYLHDATGNRRFWCIKTGKFDVAALKKDREQLWAEAVAAYNAGEKLFLEDELYCKAQTAQQQRQHHDSWLPDIKQLTWACKITDREIWEKLNINERPKRNSASSDRIASIMLSEGYVRQRESTGEREYYWQRKE